MNIFTHYGLDIMLKGMLIIFGVMLVVWAMISIVRKVFK